MFKSHKLVYVLVSLMMLSTAAYCLMSPTIQKNGHFQGLNSFQVASAKIDNELVSVCLPTLEFKDEIDKSVLLEQISEGLKAQDAIFHLYHDGLGKPRKASGMYFASDVYLKDLDMTYTGYVRTFGYKFSISKTPAYEDPELLADTMTLLETKNKIKAIEKAKQKSEKESEEDVKKTIDKAKLRVTTVYDMLPKGVIPPSIRSQQLKIASIVSNLKNRPYKTEIIQQDPLRWASGYMGMLNEKGEIDMAKCESQIVDFIIRVPDKAGWLTPEMLKEIKNTPCEYVLSRYKNGLEVVEGTRYLLHDIYFGKLKLTWEEWLEKHGLKCPEFVEKPEYATGVVPIEIHSAEGILKSLDALSICQINFTEKSSLVYPQEIMRVFPPKPRPAKKQTMKFIKAFNDAYKGKSVTVHFMVCPDGKSYTELGQKRVKRIMFNDTLTMFDACEQEVIKNMAKEE